MIRCCHCRCLALVLGVLVFGPTLPAAPVSPEVRLRDLSSGDATVRRAAAAALGEAGDRAASAALAQALSDPDAGVRREAAKALGFLKDPSATGGLIGALSDADVSVRYLAAYALGEIKEPAATAALLRALGDGDANVRTQAAWSLREIRDPSLVSGVIALLKEPRADVSLIGWLLQGTDAPGAIAPLAAMLEDADAGTRERAARALGALGGAAAKPLIGALGDEALPVRRAAVAGLAGVEDREIAKALRDFATREKDDSLRQSAAEIADRLAPPRSPGAHWSFDGEDPGKDVTGRGTDGKVTGCQATEGKVGRALDFGGKGGIELGKPAALPTANQPITVMAWVKSRAPNGVVVARGGAFCGYSLYIKDGLPKFGTKRTQEDPGPAIAAGTAPVVGEWAHLAGVIGEDRVELYVNGKLAGTAKTAGPLPGNCGQGMEIGFDAGNSAIEICDHLDGAIDEVKVFQEALDADAIAEEIGP